MKIKIPDCEGVLENSVAQEEDYFLKKILLLLNLYFYKC